MYDLISPLPCSHTLNAKFTYKILVLKKQLFLGQRLFPLEESILTDQLHCFLLYIRVFVIPKATCKSIEHKAEQIR